MTEGRRQKGRDALPLSERVRSVLPDEDPQLIREIEMTERVAMGRVSHITANGRSPRDWSLERWAVLVQLVVLVGGGIYFLGGWSKEVERDIDELKRGLSSVVLQVSTNRDQVTSQIQRLSDQVSDLAGTAKAERPSMAFPRESQFIGVAGANR